MKKLTTLLFVSQNPAEEQALFDWTLALAQRQQAQLILLNVLPQVDAGLVGWVKNLLPADIMAKQTEAVLQAWQPWAMQANQAGVVISTRVEFGRLFYKTIQTALKDQVDWVIKQTDKENKSLTEHIFGSQDMHLLRKCPCPVLLHKNGSSLPFQNIMASIDVDIEAESLTHNDLTQSILAFAQTLAQSQNANLHIAHAWQAEAENLVRYWNSDISEVDVVKFTEKVRQQHKSAVEYEIQPCRDVLPNLQVHLAKGRAEEAIPELVKYHSIDLLVMGTVGRGGIPGLVIGNTAETLLEHVNCSVLAIKPKGFVSPITL